MPNGKNGKYPLPPPPNVPEKVSAGLGLVVRFIIILTHKEMGKVTGSISMFLGVSVAPAYVICWGGISCAL